MSLPEFVRPITASPDYHWFGYYDKLQFDPTNRYVLAMKVDFEHRSPTQNDWIDIGLIDLDNNDKWTTLGRSNAWCWQQGCMLQWRPGSDKQIIWNDRQNDQLVSHLLDVNSGDKHTLPQSVYTLSPDGQSAIGIDFRRVNDMRPGYGYAGIPDPYQDQLAPADSGIYYLDLNTGNHRQIISLADVAQIPYPNGDISSAKHYFNHLLFRPDGSRFIFLHRWRFGQGRFHTRMLTAAVDGTDIRIIDDSGRTSHFIWRDEEHILAWSWHSSYQDKFYLFGDGNGQVEVCGPQVMVENGHCSYLPDRDWVLNDTYPAGKSYQELYLYHCPSNQKISLTDFPALSSYSGEWSCDLHPRFSPDGRWVTVDSAHQDGRQIYLVDLAQVELERLVSS